MSNFIESQDYKQLKEFLLWEFRDKPADIETSGKTPTQIALEVRAGQLAEKKLIQGLQKFESKYGVSNKDTQPYR